MDKEYFEELQKNIPDQVASEQSDLDDIAFLVVHADIDCELFCDGESLCQLKTNKVQKVSVSLGDHTLSIESTKNKEFVKFYPVQCEKGGKNYNLSFVFKQEEDKFLEELGVARSIEEDLRVQLKEKDELINELTTDNTKKQKELADIKKLWASEKDQFSSRIEAKEKEISNLNAEYEKKMQAMEVSCQDRIKSLSAEMSILNEAKDEEISNLNAELEKKMQTMEDSYQDRIKSLSAEISQLKEALKDPYKKASEELESKHKKELSEKDREISDIKEVCQKRIDQINVKTSSELSKMDREISRINEECQRQIDQINVKHSSELGEKDREISRIKEECQKQIASEIDEMRREFQLFKERIKKEIQNRDNEILRLQSEKENSNGGLFNKLLKK